MRIDELIAKVRDRLRGRVDSAALEAELLVAAAVGCERGQLARRAASDAGESAEEAAFDLAARRLRGEPVALLVGAREFFGRRFAVRPGVLVPRPETEHLVEVALAAGPRGTWADVGTGSGAIAVTLALERRGALRCLALDISPHAAECARGNARALAAGGQVDVVRGDLLECVAPRPGVLAGIVANPPYVEPGEWGRLPPEIRLHEPRLALVPGLEGSRGFRRRLIGQAAARLAAGGFLALEVGAGQAGDAREQLLAAGFRGVEIANDLAGIGRVVSGRRAG